MSFSLPNQTVRRRIAALTIRTRIIVFTTVLVAALVSGLLALVLRTQAISMANTEARVSARVQELGTGLATAVQRIGARQENETEAALAAKAQSLACSWRRSRSVPLLTFENSVLNGYVFNLPQPATLPYATWRMPPGRSSPRTVTRRARP